QSTGARGSFDLTADLVAANPAFQTVQSEFLVNASLAVADCNGDSIPDLVGPDGIHLGLGDGTFQSDVTGGPLAPEGWFVPAIAASRFSTSGPVEIAFAAQSPDQQSAEFRVVAVTKDGDLTPIYRVAIDSQPVAVDAIDFGNGIFDLAVADYYTG